MNRKPLISFVLVCYNQEPFIREAVSAALCQTYSPLEIIISDDCSTDRTYAVAQQVIAEYSGPHIVRLNRNETNLGLAGNINRAMEACQGELIVGGAGDDVSLPQRTELLWQVWEQSGRQATSVCSSYTTISSTGVEQERAGLRGDPDDTRPVIRLEANLGEFLATRRPSAPGCTHAWSPKLFRYFGPLTSDMEDSVLSFRSLAIGQILWIREPLVKYRRHATNMSFYLGPAGDDTQSFAHREKRLRQMDEQTVKAYDNMLADIELLHHNGRLTRGERERLRRVAQRIQAFYEVERKMMERSPLKKLSTLANAAAQGNLWLALRFSIRLLPQPVLGLIYRFRHWRTYSIQV